MSRKFRPEDWIIVDSVSVAGVTYSRGSLLPATLSPEVADQLVATGKLIKQGSALPGAVPNTAEEYLRATDFMVLDNIATHHPDLGTLRTMEALARQGTRNPLLISALHIAVLYAGNGSTQSVQTVRSRVEPAEPEVEEEVEEDESQEDESQEGEPKKEPEPEEDAAAPVPTKVKARPRRAATAKPAPRKSTARQR